MERVNKGTENCTAGAEAHETSNAKVQSIGRGRVSVSTVSTPFVAFTPLRVCDCVIASINFMTTILAPNDTFSAIHLIESTGTVVHSKVSRYKHTFQIPLTKQITLNPSKVFAKYWDERSTRPKNQPEF